jgi:hypothetical protein
LFDADDPELPQPLHPATALVLSSCLLVPLSPPSSVSSVLLLEPEPSLLSRPFNLISNHDTKPHYEH